MPPVQQGMSSKSMSEPLEILVYEDQQPVFSGEFDGSLELGRQNEGEPAPYHQQQLAPGQERLVIARREENTISRRHLLVTRADDDGVCVENVARRPVVLGDGDVLAPRSSRQMVLPLVVRLEARTIRVRAPEPGAEWQRLEAPTRPPLHFDEGSMLLRAQAPAQFAEASASLRELGQRRDEGTERLFHWLQATLEVLQSVSSSLEFCEHAAQAVVDLVGLDTCRVLLRDGEEWKVPVVRLAAHVAPEPDWRPSRRVLRLVCDTKDTFWQIPGQPDVSQGSLARLKAVVAAPILNRQGEVIGILYGDRRDGSAPSREPVSRLEALLVKLLASGLAAGLARVEMEKAALTAQVRFEQFFTPELSRQLTSQPDLLQARDVEVTVLFCDIRGFSRISEHLGAARTLEWLGQVLDVLSACVQAHGGVLVDYIGDELMAMWGAPQPQKQPDHACLACRAALAMLAELPALNERWQGRLGEPLALGIGINSGLTQVGNTGTSRKFKYGPLGPMVNLASRVQGITKYFKAPLLLTESTCRRLEGDFPARRLGKVRVVNIAETFDLYEAPPPGQPDWPALKERYEQALSEFEGREFRRATRILGNLLAEHPNDGPALVLLSRSVSALVDGPAEAHPVLVFREK